MGYTGRYLLLVLTMLIISGSCRTVKVSTHDGRGGLFNVQVRSIGNSGKHVFRAQAIDPLHTAIVIVDMWHLGGAGYVKPNGSFEGTSEGYFYQERVCDSINETISAARQLGITIIHAPADQSYLYKSHPARKNITALAKAKYPWDSKPGWNYDQQKIPFATFEYEYEYAYPDTPKDRRRPGTKSYGQNPRIVIAQEDYITDDVEELWNLLEAKQLETLIYMGGSTNMCLAGRPYGLLNMRKYGKSVLLDRNYAHLVHRIPHGWNGDINRPQYGPFYTNERNSVQVIDYFENNFCPTIDGMDLRTIANERGGYLVMQPSIREKAVQVESINLSFQAQMMEIDSGFVTDIGYEFAERSNGLKYGWNKLKIKDGIREDYDPVNSSYIMTSREDMWKIELPSDYSCVFGVAGTGKIFLNNKAYTVNSDAMLELQFDASRVLTIVNASGGVKFYYLLLVRNRIDSRGLPDNKVRL